MGFHQTVLVQGDSSQTQLLRLGHMRAGQGGGKGAGEDITQAGATEVRSQGECMNLAQMAHYVLSLNKEKLFGPKS